jgi:nucleoside phosphorylase
MKLIHLAHRGEAQEFIRNLDIKSVPDFEGLYLGEDLAVLISGEGLEATMAKASHVCGRYNITKILNFGIAGALSSKIIKDEVYKVRTCYAFSDKVQFKSFTTVENKESKTTIDCISFNQRVLATKEANQLSHFAHIVDRELWSIGYVAKLNNISFESYKLISDIAGADTDCLDIKDRALSFSEKLYAYFLKLNEVPSPDFSFITPFAMSFTHKKRYEKLMAIATQKLQMSEMEILEKIEHKSISNLKFKEKEKVNELLTRLETLIDPINSIAQEYLEKAFIPFTRVGCKVNYDRNLEKECFSIKFDINSQTNLDNLKRAIDLFDIKKINNIWNGKFNV